MVRGFRPFLDQEPYIDAYLNDPNFEENMKHGRMGYGDRNGMQRMNGNGNGNGESVQPPVIGGLG